ncbi:MAG: PaaI family thioesterase [Neisseriaceae bacterium]|nr:PaaI family thioesterase [Neisseriaceae bacterium]
MNSMPVNLDLYQQAILFLTRCPYGNKIGVTLVETRQRSPIMKVEWREALVGNPLTQVLHGGVITTLIDTTSASSIMAQLDEIRAIATLDMRVDYMTSAKPHRPLYCIATCYRLVGEIAFTEAICYQEDMNQPIARAMATFMCSEMKNINLHSIANDTEKTL